MKRLLVVIISTLVLSSVCLSAQFSRADMLDDCVSIDGLPSSLGVNMKFQPPKGWLETPSKRPHIVKEYDLESSYASLALSIIDNVTFFSRNEFREMYEDFSKSIKEELLSEYPAGKPKILDQKIVDVDRYPFFIYKVSVSVAGYGKNIPTIMKQYYTAYEDKIVCFIGIAPTLKWNPYLEFLIDSAVYSTVFPEQYE